MSLRIRFQLLLGLALIVAVGCGGGTRKQRPTPTPRPIPTPVEFAQQPFGTYKLGDPTIWSDASGNARPFEPLPGASVESGRLGGSIYQIEVPDHWNGRLVLYVQPTNGADPMLRVGAFFLRSDLIRNGFAWGASSFSSNFPALQTHADETAALWDFFVQHHGRPQYTYLVGAEASAVATRITAIRYPDRFDGAMTQCGSLLDHSDFGYYFFVAGAFVAGVTQAEFDTVEISNLIETRIRPALENPTARKRFEDIVVDLSGGPRPLAHEGLRAAEDDLWRSAAGNISSGLFDNQEHVYHLGPSAGVSDEEFNRAAVRRRRGNVALYQLVTAGAEDSYDLNVPLLTVNTTGNAYFPIGDDQQLRRKVTAAGKGDLLVQRTIRGFSTDCDLWAGEGDRGFADLVEWVEHGKKPEGEDLLANDLSDIGRAFTLLPRLGSPEADAVPGADRRVVLRGHLTFDGQPLTGGGDFGVLVRKDGMLRECSYANPSVSLTAAGSYQVTVAADAETRGCGGPGARIYLAYYTYGLGQGFISQEALDWPTGTTDVTFDASFSSQHPVGAGVGATVDDFTGTGFFGVVLDAAGAEMPPGTLVEAYIGDTRCGVFALPPVSMGGISPSGDPGSYLLIVSGPELLAGCERGGAISFRINGRPVAQTAKANSGTFSQELDLKVQE